MLQMPQPTPVSPAPFSDRAALSGLDASVMAGYLREAFPATAQCFARTMQERAAWANAAWGAYWADVSDLI